MWIPQKHQSVDSRDPIYQQWPVSDTTFRDQWADSSRHHQLKINAPRYKRWFCRFRNLWSGVWMDTIRSQSGSWRSLEWIKSTCKRMVGSPRHQRQAICRTSIFTWHRRYHSTNFYMSPPKNCHQSSRHRRDFASPTSRDTTSRHGTTRAFFDRKPARTST